MIITTPSGYVVEFKDESDLTYGDRRQIQKAMVKSIRIDAKSAQSGSFDLTGEVLFEAQEATLKLILKSITKGGQRIEGDLYNEVMNWKNPADGDAVFEYVAKAMSASPKATTI